MFVSLHALDRTVAAADLVSVFEIIADRWMIYRSTRNVRSDWMNTVGKLSAAQGLNDPKMVEENAEEQWLVLQTFSSCSFVCLCMCVCVCMRVCWHVPSARSPFSDCPICARTQQQHHKGEGLLLLTLLLFIFVCALPHEFVCVCVFVYAWLVLWDKR